MSNSTHTPEPWTYQEKSDAYTHYIRDGKYSLIMAGRQDSSGLAEADTRRVVACVNACAGISNEALEKGVYTHDNDPWEPNSERAYICSCGCKPTVEPNEEAFQVVCWGCGMRGSLEKTEGGAIYVWNITNEAISTNRRAYEIIDMRVEKMKAEREVQNA